MKQSILVFFIFLGCKTISQNVYKTPLGKKYHLASCRMVENVSKKLLGKADISKYHLTPCKICKPPKVKNLSISYVLVDKAVGESKTVRCKGVTKKGTRCKHFTKIANGYCYQHTSQDKKKTERKNTNLMITTSLCGAKTKSGRSCRRKVKGGGYCYQHQ